MKAVTFLCAVFFLSCSSGTSKPTPPYFGQVISANIGQDTTGPLSFSVSTQRLSGLQNVDTVEGERLKFAFGGNLKIREIQGSIIQSNSFVDTKSPQLRYRVENNVIVPRDYSSLVLLSAYYQFSHIFDRLKDVTGITVEEMFAGESESKYTVVYEPIISQECPDKTTVNTAKLNAAFVPGQTMFVLFRRSPIERIPMSSNLQVLSHEFGHALFDKVFYKDSHDQNGRYENEYAMRGFNEGFADFVSYGFTKSTDVLSGSIDLRDSKDVSIADIRNFGKATFSFAEYETEIEKTCRSSFYCIGTIFARSLYNASRTLDQEGTLPKDQFLPQLVKALGTTLEAMKKVELPARKPTKQLSCSSSEEEKSKTYEGERHNEHDARVIGAFLNSLIGQMPENTRATLCKEFTSSAEFGMSGFPQDMRAENCGG